MGSDVHSEPRICGESRLREWGLIHYAEPYREALKQMRGRTVNLNDTEPIAASGQGSASNAPPGAGTVPIETNAPDTVPGGPPSASALRKGQVIDRYRIVGLIASGGMARVYEAVHVFTQKSVALKVMYHRLADRQDLVARFRHEAIALASIRHQNVVNVDNAGLTEDGQVFIAMDLLKGQNLRQVLESGKRFELVEALRLVSEVAEGVAAAHAIKIVHRDLKPENIFCPEGEPAKVLDLGTAKFGGDNAPTTQTAFGKVIGTAAYIAPERLQGEVGDERCDVYSLGLMLYECIAGFHPLSPTGQWPSAAEIVSRQITYTPRPIPGLPSDVWNVIARAIHKKPDARFRSMHEFRAAVGLVIERLLRDEGAVKPARSRSSWAGLGLPIIAGIIVGAGSAATAFKLRHAAADAVTDSTPPVASVPSSQTENGVPKDVAPAVQTVQVVSDVPVASVVEVTKGMPPTAAAAHPTAAPLEARPGAVSSKSAAKVNAQPPVKPAEAASEAKSTPSVRPSGEATPNVTTPRRAKEDLPASGL